MSVKLKSTSTVTDDLLGEIRDVLLDLTRAVRDLTEAVCDLGRDDDSEVEED